MNEDLWMMGNDFIRKPLLHIPQEELTVGISQVNGEKIFISALSDKEYVSLRHISPMAARSFAAALIRVADKFEENRK